VRRPWARLNWPGWRRLAAAFVLFGGFGLLLVVAKALGLGDPLIGQWLEAARGPWALPVTVLAFAVLAALGVPQFVLIAAAVTTFGPWQGALYSWIGTMISALVGFGLGRLAGGRGLEGLMGGGVGRILAVIEANGFIASLLVRLAPLAPFAAVNMAAGFGRVRALDFVAGTGLGILPKIAVTAFAGNAFVRAMNGGGGGPIILAVIVGALWLGAGVVAARWLRGERPSPPPPPP
jgi:uncharacterized membrane protein YdjX (TVP38/TMEM64 family)